MPKCVDCGNEVKEVTSSGLCGDCASANWKEQGKEAKVRVVVDRSAEIEALQESLRDKEQVLENERAEKENLRATLSEIAQKEMTRRLELLAKQGVDISSIASEQDSETKVQKLREAEATLELNEHRKAPNQGETSNVYSEGQQTGKARRNSSATEQMNKLYYEHGLGIDSMSWKEGELEQFKKDLRKVAMDSSNPEAQKRAIEVLNELVDRAEKESWEYEYQGKLSDLQRTAKKKDANTEEKWKRIRKGEKEE